MCIWRLLLMIPTSNFQEWKNVIRQDWKRKTWSRDPTTTVALRVWNFEKLTRKVVFLFSFRKWNPQNYVARSKWGRATVGFYKRITGRVANWRRAYQSPCWTHCAVWSWSNENTAIHIPPMKCFWTNFCGLCADLLAIDLNGEVVWGLSSSPLL